MLSGSALLSFNQQTNYSRLYCRLPAQRQLLPLQLPILPAGRSALQQPANKGLQGGVYYAEAGRHDIAAMTTNKSWPPQGRVGDSATDFCIVWVQRLFLFSPEVYLLLRISSVLSLLYWCHDIAWWDCRL